jgi:hypothetical protein
MSTSLYEQQRARWRNEFLNMWYGGVFVRYWFANRSSFEPLDDQDARRP